MCARTCECFGVVDRWTDGAICSGVVGWLGVWLLPPHFSDDTYCCCLCRRLDRPKVTVTTSACYAYTWCSTTTTRVMKYPPRIYQQDETVIASVLNMPPCRYPRFFCVCVLHAFLIYGLCRRVTGEPAKESRGFSFVFFFLWCRWSLSYYCTPTTDLWCGCGWVGACACLLLHMVPFFERHTIQLTLQLCLPDL